MTADFLQKQVGEWREGDAAQESQIINRPITMDCQQDSFVRDSPARRGLLLFHSGRTEVRKFAELNPFVTLSAAEYYALRGDSADSVEWLDRAVHNGNERLEWFQRNRLLVNIRNHPRFRQIVDSIAFRRKDRTH